MPSLTPDSFENVPFGSNPLAGGSRASHVFSGGPLACAAARTRGQGLLKLLSASEGSEAVLLRDNCVLLFRFGARVAMIMVMMRRRTHDEPHMVPACYSD